jgi:hypothetical protein
MEFRSQLLINPDSISTGSANTDVLRFDPHIDRRDFLRMTAAGSAGLLVLGTSGLRRAEAGIPPVVASAFKTVAEALVAAVIGDAYARTIAAATAVKTPSPPPAQSPAPSPLDPEQAFHAMFAPEYILNGAKIPATFSRSYRYWMELNEAVRSDSREEIRPYKDLNYAEMCRIKYPREIEYAGAVVHPCGYRRPPNEDDRLVFERTCVDRYGVDPHKLTLRYVRPFTDTTRQFVGFGVSGARRPGDSDLLISLV